MRSLIDASIDVSAGVFIVVFEKLTAGWDITRTNKTIKPVYFYELEDIFFPHKVNQFQ